MDTMMIRVHDVRANEGQIKGLPRNPRKWDLAELKKLAHSIEETPELLEARGIIAVEYDGKYVALSGNMRLAAVKLLKWEKVPVILLPSDTPMQTLRQIVIKDNQQFGDWDFDELANKWDDLPLGEWGIPSWQVGEEEVGELQGENGGGEKDEKEQELFERVIIVYDKEDEDVLCDIIGKDCIDKVVYSINELGRTESRLQI